MNLSHLKEVIHLKQQLIEANETLVEAKNYKGETVPAFATVCRALSSLHRIELLPIPKAMAISAARREVDKIIAQLAAYGVTVDDPVDEPAQ